MAVRDTLTCYWIVCYITFADITLQNPGNAMNVLLIGKGLFIILIKFYVCFEGATVPNWIRKENTFI